MSSRGCSDASEFSPSIGSSSPIHNSSFDVSIPRNPARFWQQSPLPKLVLVSDFNPSFSVKHLSAASSELLGNGTSGSAYSVVMCNGVKIVVKRLSPEIISEREFRKNMGIAGKVRHANVVPLRAYYSSEEERLVLYDYYPKGSVSELLHGQIGENHALIDWKSVLRIVIGVAKGLSEIHAQNGGKLAHGNIKASNVFLNSQQYGCISDLGLANTQNVSQASDIYSFGILLLEILTRKSPVHISGAVDLVKLATSVNIKKLAANFFDADQMHYYYTLEERVVKMLQIGLGCVERSIMKRPKLDQVVEMLQNISIRMPQTPRHEPNFVSFEDDNHTIFDCDDILRGLAEVLGKGTFGTTHEAISRNGTTILVNKLKFVSATRRELMQHMRDIGGIRHENVAGLRAYCLWLDQILLGYDFHDQNNVSALLHGAGRTPLDWEIRLKIAVGAARGIAHIHSHEGRKLVHGNINSSNIFLNGQGYGLVSNAGLAKVTNTGSASQASDVYSFGLVLLELVSGKPSEHMHNGEAISLVKWIQSVTPNEYTATVVDLELLRYGDDDEQEIVRLLQVAMNCVATAPKRRPKMAEVVKMLDKVWGIYTRKQPSIGISVGISITDFDSVKICF